MIYIKLFFYRYQRIVRNGGNLDQDSSLEEYECTQKKLVKVATFS